jgi:hypothetical protein
MVFDYYVKIGVAEYSGQSRIAAKKVKVTYK